jgi:hypothetical protein
MTLDLHHTILEELHRPGRREGKSLDQVASEVLAAGLGVHAESPTPFQWIVRHLGAPRVDLEEREAVRAALETR